GWRRQHLVPMAHPAGQLRSRLADALKQRHRVEDGQLRVAVLAPVRQAHFAAKLKGHELLSIADAQHRHALRIERGVGVGSALLIDAGRPARQDEAARLAGHQCLDRRIERHDLAVDVALAHAPGDQLGVLRAKIQNEDEFARRFGIRCGFKSGIEGHTFATWAERTVFTCAVEQTRRPCAESFTAEAVTSNRRAYSEKTRTVADIKRRERRRTLFLSTRHQYTRKCGRLSILCRASFDGGVNSPLRPSPPPSLDALRALSE